jgi:hypothetical protein
MPTKEKRIRRGVREAWICPIGHRFEIHECTENLIEASRWHILIQTIQPDGGMNMRVFRLFLGAVVLFASTAFASQITYFANLSGLSEVPANASPGMGFGEVTVDTGANTMAISFSFSDLLGTTIASHIHCCTAVPDVGSAGVATQTPFFVGFPIGVTSGAYSHTFDLTDSATYNPAFVTAQGGLVANAETALLNGIAAGEAYLNVHSSVFPGGEIRGYLQPTPEPATFLMAGVALAALAWRRRR